MRTAYLRLLFILVLAITAKEEEHVNDQTDNYRINQMESQQNTAGTDPLIGNYKPINNPGEHKEFQGVDAFIRGLRNGLLQNAQLHSLMEQTVNGFNYKAIYSIGPDTHQIVVYTPFLEVKPELKAWDQIVSPSDPTIVKPQGC